jgi:hypothetical protein
MSAEPTVMFRTCPQEEMMKSRPDSRFGALLQLMERGVIEQIQLIQEFPPLAQPQFDQLVQEARPSQPSAPAKPAATDLKQFAKDYHVSPSAELRPKNGLVKVAGVPMPLAEFNELLAKASAAGLVRG